MRIKEHWENVFSTKTENEVSWYQAYPHISIDFIQQFQLRFDAQIIDVGGGDSYLIDALLELGFSNLTVLDISAKAIERLKNRLGSRANNKVTFIVSDILDFDPTVAYDLWHDRASFHFLTEKNQIQKYAKVIALATADNGKLVIGTFSEKGPTKCSGLTITQYSEIKMIEVFQAYFDFIASKEVEHQTPFTTIQNFIFCNFKRKIR
ncbi:class I SAM-dependent methyltransferase [Flavobacterium sp.]|uniref:class I SAM-dependent methyltransferase n=1 Tax=Flavobacterium sp. TaxID=239 RepID=UPI0025E051E1|nr:class I SAM-dependent methyltransferase [Flavobacterium sp.]